MVNISTYRKETPVVRQVEMRFIAVNVVFRCAHFPQTHSGYKAV